MKIKRQKLREYLAKLGMTENQFIHDLELDVMSSLDLQLGGNTLDEESSRKFLNAIGADHAMELIDWEAMNVRKPSTEAILANAY